MTQNIFSIEGVFKNPEVNTVCNIILSKMHEQFTDVDTSFCLTGTVSKIIQNETATPVKVIPFITNDAAKLYFFAKKITPLIKATSVLFPDRAQVAYKGVFLECWLTKTIGTINNINGLKVQDIADIPNNIN